MKVIGVVYGGQSHEHEVSLRSVLTLIQQMDYSKFSVVPIFISKQGDWTKYKKLQNPISSLDELEIELALSPSPAQSWCEEIDAFFPVIHGETGEDGCLQGLFEMLNVPFIGSNVEASAVGMNKVLSKIVCEQLAGVDIVPYQIVRKNSYETFTSNPPIDFPVFIKPARAGSSVGVSKAYSAEELNSALQTAFEVDDLVLVEKAINGIEIEVGVIGKDDIETSQVGEIEFLSDFYDYENKYLNDSSVMHIPARISAEAQSLVKENAEKIYKAIGSDGYARVDFFLEKESNKIYFNEINTSPGMTKKSMFPVLFSHKYTFQELLTKIIETKFKKCR